MLAFLSGLAILAALALATRIAQREAERRHAIPAPHLPG